MTDFRTSGSRRWLPGHSTPTRPFPGPFDDPVLPPLPANWEEVPPAEPAGPGPEQRFRRRVRWELVAMAGLIVLPVLPSALRGIWSPASAAEILDTSGWLVATQVCSAIGVIGLAVFLLWRDGRLRTAGLGGMRFGRVLGVGLGTMVLALGAALVAGMAVALWHALFGDLTTTSPVETGAADLTTGTVTAAILLSVAAGFSEEIVFRSYSISRFADAGWVRTGWWLPLVVWSFLHLSQGPAAVVQILSVGAVFVAVFAWTRNIWPIVLGHVLFDLAIFGLALGT